MMIFPALLLALHFSMINSVQICHEHSNFYIQETINMFENYTDLICFSLDCSEPANGVPVVTVTVEPPLREDITLHRSRNGKVAFSVKCLGNSTSYYNYTSVTVKKREPWISTIRTPDYLPLGQSCSVFGCFWDDYEIFEQRRYAVRGDSCITNPNECLDEPAVCEHECTNTYTGYNCSCWPGYQLDNNSYNCSDVNECKTSNHTCSHICSNTEGSYYCSCSPGFQLNDDNTTCTDIDECVGDSHICEHQCVNTNGSFMCACRQGFKLDDDTESCKDVDECENPKLCSQVCVNTTGSYFCQCLSGYSLSEDGHNCTANPAGSKNDHLVYFMPWLVPLIFTSILILLCVLIYYSVLRRRKYGNVLETNPDLYDFYLTQEKLDYTYQPVDLSNGLCLNRVSLSSEVTSFHSASNTVEDLERVASQKTQIVLVNHEDTFCHSKDNLMAEGLKKCLDEIAPEKSANIENGSTHDSCIGSSIAGETSSGLHASTASNSSTNDASFGLSNDTSGNSDYIPTAGLSQTSPLSYPTSPTSAVATQVLKQSLPVPEHFNAKPSTETRETDTKERKGASKTKDYIHATNALFSAVDKNSPSSSTEH